MSADETPTTGDAVNDSTDETNETAGPQRLPEAGRPGGAGRGPWMNLAMPVEKSMNFGPSARRR